MFDGLFIASIVGSLVQYFKESNEKKIPAENWENKELYNKDIMSGVPIEQLIKNVKDGKYKVTNKYPEPHKSIDGKIIIENSLLYNQDLKNYGEYQTMKWVKQGKYNLTQKELKKEYERIQKKYEYMYGLL